MFVNNSLIFLRHENLFCLTFCFGVSFSSSLWWKCTLHVYKKYFIFYRFFSDLDSCWWGKEVGQGNSSVQSKFVLKSLQIWVCTYKYFCYKNSSGAQNHIFSRTFHLPLKDAENCFQIMTLASFVIYSTFVNKKVFFRYFHIRNFFFAFSW